ncbi:MAG: hypothetical protein ABIQ44_07480 [Chloroflexia bacterium]
MPDSPSPDSWPTPQTSTLGPLGFRLPSLKERLFAALQAASLSAMLSIFWCGIASRSSAHSFWTFPNLMAGLFYGQFSLRPDFGFHTLAGLSTHLLLTTVFALLFATVAPPYLKPFTSLLLGILAATSWFYLLDGFFWRKAFPPVSLYSRRPSIFFSFVLMGICIGLYSVFVRSSKETQIAA